MQRARGLVCMVVPGEAQKGERRMTRKNASLA